MTGSQPDLRQRVTAVTRDAVINVVANLIAGAIVYLDGVGTGVFERNENLEHIAWVAVILAEVAATLLIAAAKRQDRVTYLIIAGTLLVPAAIRVAGFFDFATTLRVVLGAAGVLMTSAGSGPAPARLTRPPTQETQAPSLATVRFSGLITVAVRPGVRISAGHVATHNVPRAPARSSAGGSGFREVREGSN